MFSKIIRWVDGLFWETKIITTTKIVRRYYPPEELVPHNRGFQMMTNDRAKPFPVQEMEVLPSVDKAMEHIQRGCIVTDERIIPIPNLVLTMPPLLDANGDLDYLNFPTYRGAPLLVHYIGGSKKFAGVDGVPIRRQGPAVEGWNRRTALERMSACEKTIAQMYRIMPHETGVYKDIAINVYKNHNWLYLTFMRTEGHLVRFYQSNKGQWNTESDCVIMAFGYARSLIMTYGAVGRPYQDISEYQLAITILRALLKIK